MQIAIHRTEGSYATGVPQTYQRFEDANRQLINWSNTAPSGGKCHVVKFALSSPGFKFKFTGSYPLIYWRERTPDIKNHILDRIGVISGRLNPPNMTERERKYILEQLHPLPPEQRARVWKAYEYLFYKD